MKGFWTKETIYVIYIQKSCSVLLIPFKKSESRIFQENRSFMILNLISILLDYSSEKCKKTNHVKKYNSHH